MQWSDEGIILGVRPHGETAAVADLFTREHGRHAGLVHGGRSRRSRPTLQTGNHVDATWRARLDEHLGAYTLELKRGYAAESLDLRLALLGLTSLTSLLRLLPERDPHPSLFEVTLFVLAYIGDEHVWPALYARWELALLEELGFGLDLSACAVTGEARELVFVSPRSGRAVSRSAGAPYETKLLPLPPFMLGGATESVSSADICAALALTGHFLESRVLAPHHDQLPEARQRLIRQLGSAS